MIKLVSSVEVATMGLAPFNSPILEYEWQYLSYLRIARTMRILASCKLYYRTEGNFGEGNVGERPSPNFPTNQILHFK